MHKSIIYGMQVSSGFSLPEVDEFILKVMLCSIESFENKTENCFKLCTARQFKHNQIQ